MRINSECLLLLILVVCLAVNMFIVWHKRRASVQQPVAVTVTSALHRQKTNAILQLNATLSAIRQDLILQQSLPGHDVPVEHSSIASEPVSTSKAGLLLHKPEPRVAVVTGQRVQHRQRQAVLFTMDSITAYEQNSEAGGAAGELIIRRSLESAFLELGVSLRVLRSDAEFKRCALRAFDIILLDPWTWADKGWVPKPNLVGLEDRVYLLDFFGTKAIRGTLNVPLERVLTAYGSPWNTFLGYFLDSASSVQGANNTIEGKKLQQGVIWGKDPKHFRGRERMLRIVADQFPLVSTANSQPLKHRNIRYTGHLSHPQWLQLLRESKFLLGLSNPLLGPSAIDAVAAGCMYLNPVYDHPMRETFTSQHPYAAEQIGPPYVCSFNENSAVELQRCVDLAMYSDLRRVVPKDFTRQQHLQRVRTIFKLD